MTDRHDFEHNDECDWQFAACLRPETFSAQRTEPQPLAAAIDAPQRPAAHAPRYLSKDIRDLQVMQDRVLADNSLDDETEIPLGEIAPAEWRSILGLCCGDHERHERNHLSPTAFPADHSRTDLLVQQSSIVSSLRIICDSFRVIRVFRGLPCNSCHARARHRIPVTDTSSRQSSSTRTPRFSTCGLKVPTKPSARPGHTRSGAKTGSSSSRSEICESAKTCCSPAEIPNGLERTPRFLSDTKLASGLESAKTERYLWSE